MPSVLSKEKLRSMYRTMALIRRFEERAAQQYGLGKIAGFCHLYVGQEAVAVGSIEAVRPDDFVITAYRDHGHILARGGDPGMTMAELFGRGGGYSKGKGGSMHMFDLEHYFYGGWGIVGGEIPLGTGMAFASKYRGEDRLTLCFFGDAAANQGSFHESLNMASKWKLPVVYICENNRYGMGTDINRVSAVPEIYKRACAFAMRGEQVDGMDAVGVHDLVKDCAEHVRAGKGPVLIEARTYRYRGHSMADPATYREKSEVESERKNDPIPRFRDYVLKQKAATAEELDGIDVEIKKLVDQAVKFADESPEPSLDELWHDTTVEEGEPDVRPRERVLGVKVQWPTFPTNFKVTWELEAKQEKRDGEPKDKSEKREIEPKDKSEKRAG